MFDESELNLMKYALNEVIINEKSEITIHSLIVLLDKIENIEELCEVIYEKRRL